MLAPPCVVGEKTIYVPFRGGNDLGLSQYFTSRSRWWNGIQSGKCPGAPVPLNSWVSWCFAGFCGPKVSWKMWKFFPRSFCFIFISRLSFQELKFIKMVSCHSLSVSILTWFWSKWIPWISLRKRWQLKPIGLQSSIHDATLNDSQNKGAFSRKSPKLYRCYFVRVPWAFISKFVPA